jgi:hypothetical protein
VLTWERSTKSIQHSKHHVESQTHTSPLEGQMDPPYS